MKSDTESFKKLAVQAWYMKDQKCFPTESDVGLNKY